MSSFLNLQASEKKAVPKKFVSKKLFNDLPDDEQTPVNIPTAKKLPIICIEASMDVESNIIENLKTPRGINKYKDESKIFVWPDRIIRVQYFHRVCINRGRLYDWFVEVCAAYDQCWKTLWTAIALLDRLISQKRNICVENIHIYGMTALFMASKYHELSQNRLQLTKVVNNIVFRKFTEQDILNCEAEIFQWILQDLPCRTMHFPTMQDRIQECFKNQKLKQFEIRDMMVELFYFWQDPTPFMNEKIVMTENDLVKEIGYLVLKHKRFPDCQKNERFFYKNYGCKNMKKLNMSLKM